MKRFWKDVSIEPHSGGWRLLLDGRAVKTQGGSAQIVPTPALAQALAAEWAAQGETIDPGRFMLRDLTDTALDVIAQDRASTVAVLLRFAETDTLCYRADPEDALHARQQELWDPLLSAAEARWDVHFIRVNGVLHQPQPAATLQRFELLLQSKSDFTLAALTTLASLAASLIVALAALEDGAEAEALWNAAELEEAWQAELWGSDYEAEHRRALRLAAFKAAMGFARLAHGPSGLNNS